MIIYSSTNIFNTNYIIGYNELQRSLTELTSATLSKQLKLLEQNGLIVRTVFDQIPPKVVYSLSDLGRKFEPVLTAVEIWGQEYIAYLRGTCGEEGAG